MILEYAFSPKYYNKQEKGMLAMAFFGLFVLILAGYITGAKVGIGTALIGFSIGFMLKKKHYASEVAKCL